MFDYFFPGENIEEMVLEDQERAYSNENYKFYNIFLNNQRDWRLAPLPYPFFH